MATNNYRWAKKSDDSIYIVIYTEKRGLIYAKIIFLKGLKVVFLL